MIDILRTIQEWRRAGRDVALATLIDVERSAPLPPGAALAVNDRGEIAGSVSGGCVEADVYEVARACLAGAAARMVSYGISDAEAHEHGLTCGGTLHVLVRALSVTDDDIFERIAGAVAGEQPIAFATRLDPPLAGACFAADENGRVGSLGSTELDAAVEAAARVALGTSLAERQIYGSEARVFVQNFAPKPDMYVFGAVDFSRAMATVGRFLGYRVTAIDARPVFATRARIPDADRIVVAWPDEFLASAPVRPTTVLIVLTHDLKFDVPLLRIALDGPSGYIGVMGSRRTHAERLAALRQAGVPEAPLARLHAPVGIDIGANSPEETAISIAAEIVASRNGRAGGPLRDGTTALHGSA